jgi:antitoxin component YwqK of YwqJK toxin-antitoxin module
MTKINQSMNKIITISILILSFTFTACNTENSRPKRIKLANIGSEAIIEDGESVIKYDNGKLHKVARHSNGKLSGIQEVYNKKGELQNTMTYVNGRKEGESIIYYDDGIKYRVTPYVNNKISGERVKYRNNGNLWSTQDYLNGLPKNNLKEFTDSGKLKSTPEFIVVHKNNLHIDGTYEVKLSVKGNYKRIEYFEGLLIDGKYFDKSEVTKISNQKKNKANITIYVSPGDYVNRKYNLIAQVTTLGNNHIFLCEQVDVAVEN